MYVQYSKETVRLLMLPLIQIHKQKENIHATSDNIFTNSYFARGDYLN